MNEKLFVIDYLTDIDSYDNIYVDLDDTIILWKLHSLNIPLLKFLQESKKNRIKKIILITRSYDPEGSLGLYKINKKLFDEIITVGDKPKSMYVSDKSIFIDNNENEIRDVAELTGNPCYSPDPSLFKRTADMDENTLHNILKLYQPEDRLTPGGEAAGELDLIYTSYDKLVQWCQENYGVNIEDIVPNLKGRLDQAKALLEDADLSRSEMPVVPSKYIQKFREYCEMNNVSTHIENIPVTDILPTQSTLFLDKVFRKLFEAGSVEARVKKLSDPNSYLFLTEDFHLIDGHHRWLALFLLAPFSTKNCLVIDTTIEDAIALSNEFTDTMSFERNKS
ncbi:MAG: hypothetical protein MJZ34_03065 [Paludibacteraceae bacterium]|nr:hypothetical protein [Paludibacteraceae bacterium]